MTLSLAVLAQFARANYGREPAKRRWSTVPRKRSLAKGSSDYMTKERTQQGKETKCKQFGQSFKLLAFLSAANKVIRYRYQSDRDYRDV